ncbi:MAG TPA: response regulator [Chloroflexia bacterium]|nr:response regulator [Chloroflexia bacterium]
MQTILVVEDELPIAEMVIAILGYAGYKVVVVGNGQEALASLEDLRPDLILSDIMMPVMDGRELCKRLQAHPEHNSIPLVLMSAVHNPNNLDGCKHAEFVKKPFTVEELLDAVSKIIDEGSVSS